MPSNFEGYDHAKSWTILDESGRDAIIFTAFIGIEVSNESQAPSNPIEEGSFANYNKVQTPASLSLTLAVQGTDFELETVLDKLNRFSGEASKLIVVTPSVIYDNLTLVQYSYRRSAEQGATLLTVALTFTEVRETRVQVTTKVITKPKNPTSASKENVGRVTPKTSGLSKLTGIRVKAH
jgi:hypothetical protein